MDEDALVIIDTGGLRATSQRSLALVVLSQLWTALRERHQRRDDAPLVNLYLEEAADLAVSTLLSELLAQSRAFDLAVTLAMQFPGQLQETAPDAYAELMNNVSTIVAGNVALDTQLQRRLATDDMPPDAVGNRLRALSRGEWLVTLPAPFNEPEPRPFVVESLPLPPGHPDGPDLSEARAAAFTAEVEACTTRTAETAGVTVADPTATRTTQPMATAGSQVDSALATTDRLPDAVRYDADAHAIVCSACDARYAPTVDGIERGCQCCHDTTPARDAIPICDVPLTLSDPERQAADWAHEQLLFLQAVYAAQHQRFDPRAYDLVRDSMTRLRDDCGLTNDDVDTLCEAGLLRRDGTTPHTLYTVTTEGRTLLQEPHREGDTHGHEAGDVAESSLHALMVQLGARHIESEFRDAPDSAVTRVVRYYDRPDAEGRFDAVGVTDDDEIVVTLEAERPHNDRFEAVPADYDKLAAPNPAAALWVTPTRSEAHEVLTALNDPADGSPRVTKEYSENSPPSRWRIDEPGFTDLYTVGQLQGEYVDTKA